jgi:hypothetical protein
MVADVAKLAVGREEHYTRELAWSRAVDAVRTGKTDWELAPGTGMFPYPADHPEARRPLQQHPCSTAPACT